MNLPDWSALHWGGTAFQLALASVLTLILLAALRARSHREAAKLQGTQIPKPRPISIETELSMDVKNRWKKTFRQPHLRR